MDSGLPPSYGAPMKRLRSAPLLACLAASAVFVPALSSAQPAAAQAQSAASASPGVTPEILQKAATHDFRPANVTAVRREPRALTAVGVPLLKRAIPIAAKSTVTKFGEAVHAALKDSSRGYAMAVRKNGQPIYNVVWDRSGATTAPWSLSTKMHVASVSKLMTAIIAVKMLDERGLPFDTRIGPHFPDYWTQGTNSKDITFRDLLTHKAGFTDANYDGDFLTFKRQIEQGVAADASKNYTNGSFSLIRVVGPTLVGRVAKKMTAPSPARNDALWDLVATSEFLKYAQEKVFTPSGVTGVSSAPAGAARALAFTGKADVAGWDSGALGSQLGGAGFRLSVEDVLDVMGTFRRKGTIVSAQKAQEALDASLGIDAITETPVGKIYDKNGWWGGECAYDICHVEQSVALFLPNGMEAVVFVNSNVGKDTWLTGTVRNAYINSLE